MLALLSASGDWQWRSAVRAMGSVVSANARSPDPLNELPEGRQQQETTKGGIE